MSIKLRDYQQFEIIDPLMQYLEEHEGNPVVASPTGTGKSLAINGFIRQCLEGFPEFRCMVVAHVKEVIGQNAASMVAFWPRAPVGIYSAGLKQYDTHSPIIYAGIQSIYKKAKEFGFIDALICDEAHTISPKETTMWQVFIAGLKEINPDIRVIGFTATPYRLGMGLITEGGLFDKIVVDLTETARINQFVAEGFLSPLISKKPSVEIDITNVSMKGGDFDEHELQLASDTDDLNKAVVKECLKHGRDRNHWLVFATGITHAEHLQTQFRAVGVLCEIIHGGMTAEQRTRLIGDKGEGIEGIFQKGEIRCLINVGILTTGFDFPALDMIVLARATQSTGLYVQILGRGTRRAEGKSTCLVLDFAGNIKRLGPFNAPVIPRPRRKGDAVAGEAPVKACPECDTYVHTRTVKCPECGYEFPPSSCIEGNASMEKVMVESSNIPQFETFVVTSTHYRDHLSRQGGVCARVTYGSLTHSFSDYYFPDSGNTFLRWRFEDFWFKAGGKLPPPDSVEGFLERAKNELKQPREVKVRINKKYPDVVDRIY